MKILVTGADGQLGRAFTHLVKAEEDVTMFCTVKAPRKNDKRNYMIELDITDSKKVISTIREIQPDVIVNCAAFTNVNLCETQQELAEKVNSEGVKNLAVGARIAEAKFVQISTDYVFDGNSKKPYTENDKPSPNNVYGMTKLMGEKAALEHCDKTFIIRTAWLYGDGNNFLHTMLHLAETSNNIKVVKDQFGTPTSAHELAKVIWYLIHTDNYGIYHGSCEGWASWYEFAVEIFKRFSYDVNIIPIVTEEYATPARRPKFSVLENTRLNGETTIRMKHWKLALDEFAEWSNRRRKS